MSISPGAITPFVEITVAPVAAGRALHAASVSTHVIVSPSTSTAPSSTVSGVTTVPISKNRSAAPGRMPGPGPTNWNASGAGDAPRQAATRTTHAAVRTATTPRS